MKTTKGLLLLVSLMLALLTHLPVAAQGECVINVAGNAYITAGCSASIDERSNAIRNWADKETVIFFNSFSHSFAKIHKNLLKAYCFFRL